MKKMLILILFLTMSLPLSANETKDEVNAIATLSETTKTDESEETEEEAEEETEEETEEEAEEQEEQTQEQENESSSGSEEQNESVVSSYADEDDTPKLVSAGENTLLYIVFSSVILMVSTMLLFFKVGGTRKWKNQSKH